MISRGCPPPPHDGACPMAGSVSLSCCLPLLLPAGRTGANMLALPEKRLDCTFHQPFLELRLAMSRPPPLREETSLHLQGALHGALHGCPGRFRDRRRHPEAPFFRPALPHARGFRPLPVSGAPHRPVSGQEHASLLEAWDHWIASPDRLRPAQVRTRTPFRFRHSASETSARYLPGPLFLQPAPESRTADTEASGRLCVVARAFFHHAQKKPVSRLGKGGKFRARNRGHSGSRGRVRGDFRGNLARHARPVVRLLRLRVRP